RARCYVDTRGFFFPPELIEDSHLLPQLHGDWQSRFERVVEVYKADYFLLENWGARGELARVLKKQGVKPLYQDSLAILFSTRQVRDGLQNFSSARTNAKID